MSQPQFIPNPSYVEPRYGAVFGLGVTSGILGILSSLWLALLGIGRFVYSQGYEGSTGGRLFITASILGAVLTLLALLMFVLGILAIVRNRQRGVKLPAALLVVAVTAVVSTIVAGTIGYTGVIFYVLSTVSMLPLIIVSLLAVLAARRTAKHPVPQG